MKNKTDSKPEEKIKELEHHIQRLKSEASRSKLVEEALREALVDYERLLDNIPGILYRGYRDWHVDFFDNKIEALTGYPKEVFNSRRMKWSDLIIAADMEAVKSATRAALNENRPYVREYRIRDRRGQVRWIQDRGTIISGEAGEPRQLHGIFFDVTETKQVQAEMVRTKIELEQIFQTAADGMRVVDKDFNVLRVNDTFAALVGQGEKKCLDSKCYEVFAGSLCHTAKCPLRRILLGERRIEIEIEKQRLDGKKIQCILTATPFKNERGEVLGIVENFKDITERKQMEQSLAQSEANYRMLLSTIPSVVFKGYEDWSVDFLDNKIEELSGYPMEDFNSRKLKWSDIVVPEDIAPMRDRFKRALKNGKIYLREYRIRTIDGDIRWIRERSRIVLDEKGKIDHVSGIFSDITARVEMRQRLEESYEQLARAHKELEHQCQVINNLNENLETMVKQRTEELVKSERKYKKLIEDLKDMIFIARKDGRLTDINPSGLQMLGLNSSQNLHSLTLEDIFLDVAEATTFRKILEEQGFVKDYEARFKNGCEGIVRDVTELRRATEALIESQKMTTVGQLAAGVAHEINTPLGIILAHAQLLADDFPEGSEPLEDLKTIEKQTKICAKIVADLLEFSRRSEAAVDSTDINLTIEEVLAVMEHSLNMDRIYIVREFAEDLPLISADSEKLKQVYINMLNNAHDAIGTDGAIGIRTRFNRDSGEIVICFLDTGEGIPAGIRTKVFEPFFSTKAVGKGTGLGLSVSFGVVKQHGGYIEVESPLSAEWLEIFKGKEIGKRGPGTVFTIHLPIALEPEIGTEVGSGVADR
ncbi:MAG: PAS domain S-box protein [Deltaproteobacteria bacterium]|nr:PAS domain S-box protein [Deltaproteobacteria bacterium]